MSITNIVITSADTKAMILDQLDPQDGASSSDSLQRLSRYVEGLADGAFYYSTVEEMVGAIQALATVTVSAGGSSNNETMSIANITLTAKTSGADPTLGEFNISATAATQAASMVTAINTVSTLSGIVTATNALGVITLTSVIAGVVGNGLQLSESLTNVAITHAWGTSVAGTNGSDTVLS